MLAIRMQRTGRKGHAMFRVIVQDSRRTPTSGRIVAQLGSYDPHAKSVKVDKEKASFYLEHGAQPSERAAKLLKGEGIALPKWVQVPAGKERTVRNPDKRRSTAPSAPEEPAAEETAAPAEDVEAPAAETAEAPTETAEAAPAEAEPADDAAPEA